VHDLQNTAVDDLSKLLQCINSSCDCYKMECCIEQHFYCTLGNAKR